MSLPLSAEIVATDISLGDNVAQDKMWGGGWEKQRTRAVASCSKLGDEKASCGELQSLPLPGFFFFV